MRTGAAATVLVVLLLAAGYTGYQLGVETPAETETNAPSLPPTVRVARGNLEIVTFATAELRRRAVGRVRGSGGTVTELLSEGDTVREGAVVMSVDLEPVIVFEGTVPMFRDITIGDSGRDVTQIQEALTRIGIYDAPVDGKFGRSTLKAWNRFLESRGYGDVKGITRRSVAFVSSLPAWIDQVMVAAGDEAAGDLMALTETDAQVIASVPAGAIDTIAPGDGAELIAGDQRWPAAVVEVTEASDRFAVVLEPSGPLPEGVTFRARIISTIEGDGLILPVTAVYTDAGGSTYVRHWDPSGTITQVPVEVTASTGDHVMITGAIKEGDEVVVGS